MLTRKRTLMFAALVVCGLLLSAGCKGAKGKAKAVLTDYVVAEGVGAKKAQKEFLVEEDRKVLEKQLEERKSKFDTSKLAEIAEEKLGDKFKVAIKEAKVDGETMAVTAEVTRPNEDELKKALFGKIMKVAMENKDKSDEEVGKALVKAVEGVLKESDFSTETTEQSFTLRKEGDKWLVYKNLKAQQEIKDAIDSARKLSIKGKYDEARKSADEIKGKIDENGFTSLEEDYERLQVSILSGEARKLARDDEYGKAIANYEKIVELDPAGPFALVDADKAKTKIEELKTKKAKKEKEDAYKEKLALNGVEVKTVYGSTRIVGELKNDGDKTLNKVELAIKFLDKDGKEVHQATTSPVLALNKKSRSFKPGHSKKFRHYASKAPDAWDKKSVEVNVANVEFFEEK